MNMTSFFPFLLCLLLSACGRVDDPSEEIPEDKVPETTNVRPVLDGRMVYHNYTSYDAMDSKMYLYDFKDNSLNEISRNWTVVKHPMNGHFSPDGKKIVFMGIGTATKSWDIFLYELGSESEPENLTPAGNYRDEDPKFSFSGDKICFKRGDKLAEIELKTGRISVLSHNNADEDPYSMPYYSADDSKMLFGGGHNPDSYIGLFDIATSASIKLYDKASTVEYYPVTIDEKAFYFTRHVSSTDTHDQLYKGYFNGSPSKALAFNKPDADYSDACPVENGWLILVSTRRGSKGGYDLYISHENDGTIYSLSDYNSLINTDKNELGPDYTSAR